MLHVKDIKNLSELNSAFFDKHKRQEFFLSFIDVLKLGKLHSFFSSAAKLQLLAEMTEIVGTTKKEIIQALKNNFYDYEDSLQYSSALTIENLDAIITRNIKDYRNSTIAVMTPLNFLKMKEKNEY